MKVYNVKSAVVGKVHFTGSYILAINLIKTSFDELLVFLISVRQAAVRTAP